MTCAPCSAEQLETLLDLGSTALANELKSTKEEALAQERFPLVLARCRVCGLVQLRDPLPTERLFTKDYPYQSGTSPVFRKHLEQFAKDVPCSRKVLEIGSNDGTLLDQYQKQGAQTVGVDPAGKPSFGAHLIFREPWDRYSMPRAVRDTGGKFSLIVGLNVFAHMPNLSEAFELVALALVPDGRFVFEVGYVYHQLGIGALDVIYHEHIYYHSIEPLKRLLAEVGLEIVHVDHNDSQGGSIRVTAMHAGKVHPVAIQLPPEPDFTLEELPRYAERLRESLGAVCKGRRVIGYGAPAKLTTLMAIAGLTAGDIKFVVDDNPLKVGKFTPGTGIPILPTSALETDQHDRVLLFSWNFAEEIMARHHGQVWIVPLPEVVEMIS